jgi:hypothetical protein
LEKAEAFARGFPAVLKNLFLKTINIGKNIRHRFTMHKSNGMFPFHSLPNHFMSHEKNSSWSVNRFTGSFTALRSFRKPALKEKKNWADLYGALKRHFGLKQVEMDLKVKRSIHTLKKSHSGHRP